MKFWLLIFCLLHVSKSWALLQKDKGLKAVLPAFVAPHGGLNKGALVPLNGFRGETHALPSVPFTNSLAPEKRSYQEQQQLQQQAQYSTMHLESHLGYHYPKTIPRPLELPSASQLPNASLLASFSKTEKALTSNILHRRPEHADPHNLQYFPGSSQSPAPFARLQSDQEVTDLSRAQALSLFLKTIYKQAKQLLEANNHQREKASSNNSTHQARGYVYAAQPRHNPVDYAISLINSNRSKIYDVYPEINPQIHSKNCQASIKSGNLPATFNYNGATAQSDPHLNDFLGQRGQSGALELMQSGGLQSTHFEDHSRQSDGQYDDQSVQYGHQSTLSSSPSNQSGEQLTQYGGQSHSRQQSTQSGNRTSQFDGSLPHLGRHSIQSDDQSMHSALRQSHYKGQSTRFGDQSTLYGDLTTQLGSRTTQFADPLTHSGQLIQSIGQSANQATQYSDRLPPFYAQSTRSVGQSTPDQPTESANQPTLSDSQAQKQFADPSTQFAAQLRKLIAQLLRNYNRTANAGNFIEKYPENSLQNVQSYLSQILPSATESSPLAASPSPLPPFRPMTAFNNFWKPIIQDSKAASPSSFLTSVGHPEAEPTAPVPLYAAGQKSLAHFNLVPNEPKALIASNTIPLTLGTYSPQQQQQPHEYDQIQYYRYQHQQRPQQLQQQQQHHQFHEHHSPSFVPASALSPMTMTTNSPQFLGLPTDYSAHALHQPHRIYGVPLEETNATPIPNSVIAASVKSTPA